MIHVRAAHFIKNECSQKVRCGLRTCEGYYRHLRLKAELQHLTILMKMRKAFSALSIFFPQRELIKNSATFDDIKNISSLF